MSDPFECMRVLSDPTRFSIVNILLHHDLCSGAVARRIGVSDAAVSQHIKVLRQAGLVSGEKYGYFVHYSVDTDVLNELSEFIGSLASSERMPCDPEAEGCTAKRRGSCPSEKGHGGCCQKRGRNEAKCYGCNRVMSVCEEREDDESSSNI